MSQSAVVPHRSNWRAAGIAEQSFALSGKILPQFAKPNPPN
jgi:hypothetical protein